MIVNNFRNIMIVLIVFSSLLAILFGCAKGSGVMSDPQTKPSDSASSKKERVTITIGHQSPTAQTWGALIMKDQKLYEKHLQSVDPDIDFIIDWFDSPSGPPLNNSMVGGDMRMAFMGDMPILSNGAVGITNRNYDSIFIAFDGKGTAGKNQSILVPLDGVNEMKDLAGMTVSTPTGSSAHRMLLAALEQNGLIDDVEVVGHTVSVGLQSIEEGKIGAHATWEPWPSFMEFRNRGKILLDGAATQIDYLDGVVADRNWVEANPEYTVAFLKALIESHQFIQQNPEEAAQIFAKESEFPLEVTELMVQNITFDSAMYKRDIETLEGSLKFLLDQDLIAAGLDLHKFIDDSYLKKAADELNLKYLSEEEYEGKWIDWVSR